MGKKKDVFVDAFGEAPAKKLEMLVEDHEVL